MDKIIYISPKDLSGINSISELANFDTFLNYLDPVDYHFILFSTLYQSGTNFFQLNSKNLPEAIRSHPFWKNKFVDIDNKPYQKAAIKATKILNGNFDLVLDKKYNAPQFPNLHNYFTSLFYSAETGIPFINVDYPERKSFDFMESRLSKELFLAINNLNSQVQSDKISTITPQYSVLKKDVKRFEDIATSAIYRNYSDSLGLLVESSKIEVAKKEIHINALKVYNKYAKHLDLTGMTFGLLKFNKKLADLFVNKATSVFGDYIIDTIEKATSGKRKVCYYKVDEAHYMIQWANRIGELMSKGGRDKLQEFLDEYSKKN